MREKPIIFSTGSVQAILAGDKTQTRRAVRDQSAGQLGGRAAWQLGKLRFRKGDVLYVRETWGKMSDVTETDPELGMPDYYLYRADREQPDMKWRPAIFMPKAAARLLLEVTASRIERLQDITLGDCMAEGVADISEYRELWDALNARRGYGWGGNPWVEVVEFRRLP